MGIPFLIAAAILQFNGTSWFEGEPGVTTALWWIGGILTVLTVLWFVFVAVVGLLATSNNRKRGVRF